MVSTEQMKTIIPDMNWGKAQVYMPHINTVLPKFGIDTSLRMAHFLAQISHESGGLHYIEENLNYSAKALRVTFRKYFDTLELAQAYERQPEKIANRVYANRMGNGDEASGDGWKYRGRGLIQLTGKENYQHFSKEFGVDCVNNPDLIKEPEWALTSACWFWKKRSLNKYADTDDIHMVTKRINGGTNGLLHRQHYLEAYKQLFKMMEIGV